MSEEKKTTLRIEIDKTIQPQQYEPIKIQVSVEESFCWKDEEDRTKKMKICTEKITEDFVSSFDHVLERIGEKSRCIGRVSNTGSSPVEGKKEITSSVDEEEFSFD